VIDLDSPLYHHLFFPQTFRETFLALTQPFILAAIFSQFNTIVMRTLHTEQWPTMSPSRLPGREDINADGYQ
jgi:hypothetical protein